MFKVNNRSTNKRCELCSKLTINTPQQHHWRQSSVFIVNFEHISQLFLVFLSLTLNKQMLGGQVLYRITDLKTFVKFAGKHPWRRSFLVNKVLSRSPPRVLFSIFLFKMFQGSYFSKHFLTIDTLFSKIMDSI